ncbi:MAG: peptidoglycan DD-metalloendopeptidase family protein [Chitinophagaceae bacterium]|nr:peptidoglycan DD-metalloendopeptidase family protein [Chitinophagaceae bacterium]
MMLTEILLKYQDTFQQIVPFDASIDKKVELDLSDQNQGLNPEIYEDTLLFSAYIDTLLQQSGARYGCGGYFENRILYARSSVFNAAEEKTEARTLHLGVDIWGKAGTVVMAPLHGKVHSKGNHAEYGNYGATIILEHLLDDQIFYTLYGHLSYNDLSIEVGSEVKKGQIFAQFGPPQENGHWPPHLHFQIIQNLEGFTGDYPGVCAPSTSEHYRANCPDPQIMLKW